MVGIHSLVSYLVNLKRIALKFANTQVTKATLFTRQSQDLWLSLTITVLHAEPLSIHDKVFD